MSQSMYTRSKPTLILNFNVASDESAAIQPARVVKLKPGTNAGALPFQSSNEVTLATDAVPVLGVTVPTPEMEYAAGESVDVVLEGVTPVIYGGNVTAGTRVMPTTGGKVIAATTGKESIGVALATGVADDLGAILIDRHKLA